MLGYWVNEWFPKITTPLTSSILDEDLETIWLIALLWSNLVKQVIFFFGISGLKWLRI